VPVVLGVVPGGGGLIIGFIGKAVILRPSQVGILLETSWSNSEINVCEFEDENERMIGGLD